jgi:monoamine oxidase
MACDFDVIVIGAGAAGIGAGLALSRLRVVHIIIEAKDRIGGRAYSESQSLGYLWDHGCHWFHSVDKNVLRKIAERLGHGFRKEQLPDGYRSFVDGKPGPLSLRDHVWAQLDAISEVGSRGHDIPANEALDKADPLYPLVRHWVSLMYSVEAEEVSTGDAGNSDYTGIDRAVGDGYGVLIAKLAAGLPIRLGTPASRVDVTHSAVKVTTSEGELSGKAVIVAVPQRIIEKGGISFTPKMPAELEGAFQNVPMGWYEKIAIGFNRQVFDSSFAYADVFEPSTPQNHPVNFELHPFGRLIAIAHVGGNLAREMEQQGEAAMVDFATGALVRNFGADLRKHIRKGVATHWGSDDHIGGAYSTARPGHAQDRWLFSRPLHERVFFAGEHTSVSAMATAHGAYMSGIEAAHRAAETVGYAPLELDPLWLPEGTPQPV